jgi:hypothetical protein
MGMGGMSTQAQYQRELATADATAAAARRQRTHAEEAQRALERIAAHAAATQQRATARAEEERAAAAYNRGTSTATAGEHCGDVWRSHVETNGMRPVPTRGSAQRPICQA